MAPRSDALVLLTCFALTVFFDMTVAVTAGVLLAAVLFMRRMAELSGGRLVEEGSHPALREPLPAGALLYQVQGPLFFGAAEKAMESLHTTAGGSRVVLLEMSAVPVIDATGMVNLESALARLAQDRALVVLVGVQSQPAKFMARAGIEAEAGRLAFAASLDAGVALARSHLARSP